MISRRAFLRATGALTLAGWAGLPDRFLAALAQESPDLQPDLDVALSAIETTQPIFSGNETRVWKYQGEILAGRNDALVNHPESYLGPTFRVRQGERVRIRFRNQIPEESIIHWHGLRTPPEMDGHPRDVVGPGQEYIYEFTVIDRAGTYWYHPHPHRRTGPQVYYGLAGLFLVSDPEEDLLGLPADTFDLPLVLQDRTFDAANQLVYLTRPAEQLTGFLGEQILVNGRPEADFAVETRPYRLRLLNGSNARIYRLAWADGQPLTVIATDGGLLERPLEKPYLLLGPGERVDVWADFSSDLVGSERRLVSLPTITGGMGRGMGRGAMGGAGDANGAPFEVATLRITRTASTSWSALPTQLSTLSRYQPAEAVNAEYSPANSNS